MRRSWPFGIRRGTRLALKKEVAAVSQKPRPSRASFPFEGRSEAC